MARNRHPNSRIPTRLAKRIRGKSPSTRRFKQPKKMNPKSIETSNLLVIAAKENVGEPPTMGIGALRLSGTAAYQGFLHVELQVLTHVAAHAAQPASQKFLAFSSSKKPHAPSLTASTSAQLARQAARGHGGNGLTDEYHCCHM